MMILLFTDFGCDGFYVGQMHAVIARQAPGVPIIDLMHDAPAFDPAAAAYLLGALSPAIAERSVVVAVVDPGVGGERRPIVVRADERLYVGPDNGLFELIMRQAKHLDCHSIDWRPDNLSDSFHGRDLFAPVAAALANGATYGGTPLPVEAVRYPHWPEDLPAVIYIDGFGNLITGVRAQSLGPAPRIGICGASVPRARTFSDVPTGSLFWYENSIGLVEIAANQGNAASMLRASIGSGVEIAD